MKHENIIHQIADDLLEYFDGEGAVNFIEQTYGCNNDPSKSFVLTMQKVDGLTPCQKLAKAETINNEMYDFLDSIADGVLDESQNKELLGLLAKARGEK